MRKLYICEYPYVLYKLLIERLGDTENSCDLILSDSFADLQPMVPVLRQSGLFDRVEFFPSEPYRDYYHLHLFDFPKSKIKKALTILRNQLIMTFRQKEFKNIEFPFNINFRQYGKIICTDQPCVINGYLGMNHISFAISEHAKGFYGQGQGAISIQSAAYVAVLSVLDKLHILHGTNAASRFCKEIIANDISQVSFCVRHKKMTAWNVKEHLSNLKDHQKDLLFRLYADAYGFSIDLSQKYDLLLTSPLYTDGCLPSEAKQIEFYKDIIREHFDCPVLIKPHPRDTVDYAKAFPECTVIDPNISSEVLSFSRELKLSTVLTVSSTSAAAFADMAEKTVSLGRIGALSSQLECLKAYQ